MINKHNKNEKVVLNEIIFRVTVNEKTNPETKPFGMDFRWEDKPPKELLLKELDKRWEEIKAQIIQQVYGE